MGIPMDFTKFNPHAFSYFERLRVIVGNPLVGFPQSPEEWIEMKDIPQVDLVMKYGLTPEQAVRLQQVLLLVYELHGSTGGILAPARPKEWASLPEVDNIRKQPKEHLMMFVVNEDGHYSSHLLGIGTEWSVPFPNFDGMVSLYRKMKGRSLILVHNHPNDFPSASDDDIQVTEQLQEYFADKNVRFEDHIIVMKSGGFYSMRECGYFGYSG